MTSKTVANAEELERQLSEFRTLGYAIDDEEGEEGLYCYAAPIFGANREVIAAISTAGPKARITKNSENIVFELLNTAAKISKSMGYFKKARK